MRSVDSSAARSPGDFGVQDGLGAIPVSAAVPSVGPRRRAIFAPSVFAKCAGSPAARAGRKACITRAATAAEHDAWGPEPRAAQRARRTVRAKPRWGHQRSRTTVFPAKPYRWRRGSSSTKTDTNGLRTRMPPSGSKRGHHAGVKRRSENEEAGSSHFHDRRSGVSAMNQRCPSF
jgi:hypothetical protein